MESNIKRLDLELPEECLKHLSVDTEMVSKEALEEMRRKYEVRYLEAVMQHGEEMSSYRTLEAELNAIPTDVVEKVKQWLESAQFLSDKQAKSRMPKGDDATRCWSLMNAFHGKEVELKTEARKAEVFGGLVRHMDELLKKKGKKEKSK